MTFRGLLMWIHLVLGLTGAIVIAIASVTGAYITFQGPLERWLIPVPRVENTTASPDLHAIVSAAESVYAPRRVLNVVVRAGEATVVTLTDRSKAWVNPADASVIRFRQGKLLSLENITAGMRRLHTNLLIGRNGRMIVTLATAEALFLGLTGAWLWWRRKHWRFRPWRGSVFRVSWDLHNATGIWFLLPVLSIVVTGLLIAVPAVVFRYAGAPEAPWPEAPQSSGVAGSPPPVALVRVLAVADSVRPGEPVTGLAIPAGSAGAIAVVKARETIYLDKYTGRLIEVRPHRVPTEGDHALEAVEALHTGELYGVPGRTVMTLGSLMLAVMAVTGVVLGWKRFLILARRATENT